MITSIPTTNQDILNLTAVIEQQLILERQAREAEAKQIAAKEEELRVLREKNDLEMEHAHVMQQLGIEITRLSVKIEELHAAVMHYTSGYINEHHIPIFEQLRYLVPRVDILLQLFSSLTPMLQNDERSQRIKAELFDLMRQSPPQSGGAGVVIHTGGLTTNTNLNAQGDMQQMNISSSSSSTLPK